MLQSNISNQSDQESTDLNTIHPNEMYWNKFDKKMLTSIKPKNIDIYDKEGWTREEFDRLIMEYKRIWILEDYKKANLIDVFRKYVMNYQITSHTDLCNEDLMKEKLIDNLCEIQNLIRILKIMSKNEEGMNITKEEWDEYDDELKKIKIYDEEFKKYSKIIKTMQEILYYSGETMSTMSIALHASSPYHNNTGKDIHKMILRKWSEHDQENEKDHVKLLRCIYEICEMKRYSKYNDLIYKPVYTRFGDYAYSCEKVDDIEHFVECQISRDKNPMLWDLAHKDKSTISYIKTHLKACVDSSLPALVKDRTLFSFENGIYKLNILKVDKHGREYYTDKFYPYKNPERPKLKQGTVSCKYFNQEMVYRHYDDWYDIPTPNIQKIFDLQYEKDREYEDISRWMYILAGRLLYEIGKLDGWQVIAFMKGLAGTGKGTFIKAIQKFFDVEDVGVLSNDGQKQFAVSALLGKLLFVAPEIKGDLSLPQAIFQSMISGEDVSVDIKHKTAQTITWVIPGILAGNEVPGWTDNSGSIARRLIIFGFNKKVPTSQLDPELWNKIDTNIPNFLRKCNLAYLDAVNKWKHVNVWKILPDYFTNRRKELSEQTNDVMKFLRSPGVIYGKNYYVSLKKFRKTCMEYCKELGKRLRFRLDKLDEPFQTLEEEYDTEISIVKIDRRKKKKLTDIKHNEDYQEMKGTWIRGLTIQDEDTNEIQDDPIFIEYLKNIERVL